VRRAHGVLPLAFSILVMPRGPAKRGRLWRAGRRARGSPHLAEQQVRNREFIGGTLYDVLSDAARPPADMPVVFSPFGLGVLDLTVAKYVYDRITADGEAADNPRFLHEFKRLWLKARGLLSTGLRALRSMR